MQPLTWIMDRSERPAGITPGGSPLWKWEVVARTRDRLGRDHEVARSGLTRTASESLLNALSAELALGRELRELGFEIDERRA